MHNSLFWRKPGKHVSKKYKVKKYLMCQNIAYCEKALYNISTINCRKNKIIVKNDEN